MIRASVRRLLACLAAAASLHLPATAQAAEVLAAVASNFTLPMQRIATDFQRETGHTVRLSFGATGTFHAQIRSGAPFMVLLAADDEVPARLERENLAVPGTRFTYAKGRLVLWSAKPGVVDDQGAVLQSPAIDRIALANPALAPYGAAAVETLSKLRLLERLRPRLVQGENIGQTFQFVATGNTTLGFVALSQVMVDGRIAKGSAWIVPASLHAPLRQDAVILLRGKDNPAAAALMAYLRTDKARAIMRGYGYEF